MKTKLAKSHNFEYLASILALVLGISLVVIKDLSYNYALRNPLPQGGDEFGYMELADDFRQAAVFHGHQDRHFLPELLSFLKERGYSEETYSHLLTPLSYRLREGKVVNQFPPGTSFVLSIFHRGAEKPAFAAICLSLFFSLVYLALRYRQVSIPSSLGIALFCAALIQLFPVSGLEFTRVNSVAPTYGLMIASGILYAANPLISIALLSFSTLFRIANVVSLSFAAVFYLFFLNKNSPFVRKSFQVLAVSLVAGVGWYLMYLFFLTGSPLVATYGPADVGLASVLKPWRLVRYYIGLKKGWFVAHLIGIGVLSSFAAFYKPVRKMALFGILLTLLNYLFFFSHKVRISYYPYASAILVFGLIIDALVQQKKSKVLLALTLVGFIWGFSGVLALPSVVVPNSENLKKAERPFLEAFSDSGVVWAGIESGKIQYAASVPTFRFHWGGPKVRQEIIQWLYDHNVQQVFFVGDRRVSTAEVKQALDLLKLPYEERKLKVGRLILVKPENAAKV